MGNIEREILSPSGKYKATIADAPDYYKIDIYTLSDDYNFEQGVSYGEYWLRNNKDVILFDKKSNVIDYAVKEIRLLLGEPTPPLSIEWVRDYSFCKDAEFLNPKEIEVSIQLNSEISRIDPKTIIYFSGLCLVEPIGSDNTWMMGQLEDNMKIICWEYYGTLKEAIDGL